jgi:hypothetical protein
MGDKEEDTLQYQFKVDRQLWEEWKETVPRSKKLYERIITLVEQDLAEKRE